jgi:hypothetical protein
MKNHNPPKKPKLTDAERHERFVDTANKVEASDDAACFDEAFDKIASPVTTVRSAHEVAHKNARNKGSC